MVSGSIGPYEIVSLLGAGGMGEVYRARDAKLNRDVALKVLPELFTADPDRLARFRREAQVLASLNHPNIGAHLRLRGFGRHACACPRTRRGSDARGPHRARPFGARRGAPDRAPDRRRARVRARARHRPSRSEAREHQGASGRHRQGPGLRSRESVRWGR